MKPVIRGGQALDEFESRGDKHIVSICYKLESARSTDIVSFGAVPMESTH